MTIKIKKITFVLRPDVNEDLKILIPSLVESQDLAKQTLQFSSKDKVKLQKIFGKKEASRLNFIAPEDLYKKSDLIVALGGDGTIINVGRHITKKSPPIFGVNLGHLGFIAQFTKEEVLTHLKNCLNSKYDKLDAHLYSVKVFNGEKMRFHEYFMNDVVFSKNHISRIFTLAVRINGELIYNVSGDGLIVSSPLGSTAYSLAAHGPIVHPSVPTTLLTPICPHGLTYRPMAIPDHEKVEVSIVKRPSNLIITLDGQSTLELKEDDRIVVEKDKDKIVYLVKNPHRSYFQTLKEKFFHGK